MPEPTGTDPTLAWRIAQWLWTLIIPLLGYVGWRLRDDRQRLEAVDVVLEKKLDAKVDSETFRETIERIETSRAENRRRQEKKSDEIMEELKGLRGDIRQYDENARRSIRNVYQTINEARKELDGKINGLRSSGAGDD